jgi:hypothetical protein
MAKKLIIPNEDGILWRPKKDPKKKQVIDPLTGRRLGQYGKMPKKVVFFEEVPEEWDVRSWRLQVYSFLERAAANVNTTPRHMLMNAGYNTEANIKWMYAMKKDDAGYRKIHLNMIERIARMTNTTFTLQ